MKTSTLHLTLVFLVLFLGQNPTTLSSQDKHWIHAFVMNEQGGPLIGVNVVAKKAGAFIHGTTTDLEGAFEIQDNADLYEISYIGYGTRTMTKEEIALTPEITLKSGIDLEMVVVKAYHACIDICCNWGCGGIISSNEDVQPKKEDPFPVSTPSFLTPFPNPTIDYIQVNTPAARGTLQLFSSNGSILQTQQVYETLSVFDLSNYPAGMYVVSYANEHETVSAQVIKSKL